MKGTNTENSVPYNEPAFPNRMGNLFAGMTLRDYFAAAVIQGFVAGSGGYKVGSNAATHAYQIADEMLKARAK